MIRVFDADGDQLERIVVRAGADGVWSLVLDGVETDGPLELQVRVGGELKTFRFDPSDFGGGLSADDGVGEDQFSGRLFREVFPDRNGFGSVSERFGGTLDEILNL